MKLKTVIQIKIMRDNEGCIRAYHRSNKAYYAKALVREETVVNFGMFDPEGGTSGEMNMTWVEIGRDIACPQLQVFDDGWSALGLFTDLIQELAKVDSKNINDDKFCDILERLGFKDLTAYENPNPEKDKLISINILESTAKKLNLI